MQILKSEDGFYASVEKALTEIDPKWQSYEGLLITGTHNPTKEVEEASIHLLKEARENNIPTLGICFGMQMMAVEYARNVKNIKNATSQEFGEGTLVVSSLPGVRVGLYPVGDKMESHWHNYYVHKDLVEGWPEWEVFATGEITEVMALRDNTFYVGCQYHPEYQSSKEHPHPLLKEFIKSCRNK